MTPPKSMAKPAEELVDPQDAEISAFFQAAGEQAASAFVSFSKGWFADIGPHIRHGVPRQDDLRALVAAFVARWTHYLETGV